MRKTLLCLTLFSILSYHASAQIRDTMTTLVTKTGTIYGTLTRPANQKGAVPLAIFIAGSGPTDRDGNNPMMKNNSLRMLSDSLLKYGIATLRYDKRGIAASTKAAPNETVLRFPDYVKDVQEWVKKYSKDKRFSRIYIVGHSEGSLVGMIAAQDAPVAGYVSIAGAARPADEVIIGQLEHNAQVPRPMADTVHMFFDMLKKNGSIDSNIIPRSGFYQSIFRPSVQPYLLSWIKYDPAIEMAKVTKPTMIIQGTSDIQVDTVQARMLATVRPDAQLLIIPNMNHIFKKVPADNLGNNYATYYDQQLPVMTELVQAIRKFILGNPVGK
jgi:pimeloyl-ACP methyl ester carboxylesterase